MRRGLAFGAVGGLAAATAGAFWLWTPDLPRSVLEARYLHGPQEMMAFKGARLRVRDEGPRGAPALIMIHGFGSSLETWEPWARLLKDRFRVIRFDLPGSGLSPPDAYGDYSDARSCFLLETLMTRLGIPRAVLIGNSIGGRIAFTFAARRPGLVDRLVLISPDGFASPGFDYGRPPKTPPGLDLMRWILPRALVRANLVTAYGDPSALSAATVKRTHDLLRAPGARAALLARMRGTILTDPKPLLARIKAPVLLLWGERDGMIPFANGADYVRELPSAKLVALFGLGHVPQEEAPALALRPLLAFLETTRPPG